MTRVLYYLYERRLVRQIGRHPVPRHVGIILDGNRRYARERGVRDPVEAYGLGARKLDDVLEGCAELAIPAVTLWVFSTENLRRSPAEVSGILSAIDAKLTQLAHTPRIHHLGVRVRAVGKLDLLPDATLAAIRAAEEATAAHRALVLTIAVAYGGRQEIADAVQALLREKAKQGEDLETVIEGISQEAIGRYLYAPRSARPRPHHSDQRGDSALRLLALAERLQRILLLRRPLARLPEGRLPPGRAGVPAARTPPGIIGEGIGRADAWGEDTHASTDAAVRGRPRSPALANQPSGA